MVGIRRVAPAVFAFGIELALAQQSQMPVPLMDPSSSASGVPHASPSSIPRQTPEQVRATVARYGTILASTPVGVGGLTAWTVEKAGRTLVLYTTEDGQALMAGPIWDAATGVNVSDGFSPARTRAGDARSPQGPASSASSVDRVVAQGAQSRLPGAAARVASAAGMASAQPQSGLGAVTGAGKLSDVPESIRAVDALPGVKEGRGDAANTLYVIFDPRCPYCREAYAATRRHVTKGRSIKWIPANALGDPATGTPLAAALLQAPEHSAATVLARVLGSHDTSVAVKATPETELALQRNLQFLTAAFRDSNLGPAGVPVGFYFDARDQKAHVLKGVSQSVVLDEIFGRDN